MMTRMDGNTLFVDGKTVARELAITGLRYEAHKEGVSLNIKTHMRPIIYDLH